MTRKQKSRLMSLYNTAKKCYADKRSDRAFGLAQRKGTVKVFDADHGQVLSSDGRTWYDVRLIRDKHGKAIRWMCTCPDRHPICKHKRAFWLKVRAIHNRPQTMPKPAPRPRERANGRIARMRQCMELARAA